MLDESKAVRVNVVVFTNRSAMQRLLAVLLLVPLALASPAATRHESAEEASMKRQLESLHASAMAKMKETMMLGMKQQVKKAAVKIETPKPKPAATQLAQVVQKQVAKAAPAEVKPHLTDAEEGKLEKALEAADKELEGADQLVADSKKLVRDSSKFFLEK
eukprot:TRINITY_DN8248_c0_g1_i1.p1 TRINITY_DN8248_c0_g1~~TRINITY_DN8248_c0_g1_i1.p1  ORF type:complete len:161 (+),score=70.18 TRINITY_DN8248_c0_g1_i1:366-848(+)